MLKTSGFKDFQELRSALFEAAKTYPITDLDEPGSWWQSLNQSGHEIAQLALSVAPPGFAKMANALTSNMKGTPASLRGEIWPSAKFDDYFYLNLVFDWGPGHFDNCIIHFEGDLDPRNCFQEDDWVFATKDIVGDSLYTLPEELIALLCLEAIRLDRLGDEDLHRFLFAVFFLSKTQGNDILQPGDFFQNHPEYDLESSLEAYEAGVPVADIFA